VGIATVAEVELAGVNGAAAAATAGAAAAAAIERKEGVIVTVTVTVDETVTVNAIVAETAAAAAAETGIGTATGDNLVTGTTSESRKEILPSTPFQLLRTGKHSTTAHVEELSHVFNRKSIVNRGTSCDANRAHNPGWEFREFNETHWHWSALPSCW